MSLTLQEVLEFPILQSAGARVLCAQDQLHREIKWVHSAEIPDIAEFLSGGELLLTAGLGMGATEEKQKRFVRDVARAGAAAIVIEESGRMFEEVPRAIVDEAAANGLVIVALGKEVAFAEVSATIHRKLTQQELASLEMQAALEEEFSKLVLDGADSFAIISFLSGWLRATVVLENASRQIITYKDASDGNDGGVDIAAWQTHSRSLHENDACVTAPVIMRGQPWGWIHAFVPENISFEPAYFRAAVKRAAAYVTISLLTDRNAEAKDYQRGTAFISRLLLGDLSGSAFVERCHRIGQQIDADHLQVLVLNKGVDPTYERPSLSELQMLRQRQPVRDMVHSDFEDTVLVITSNKLKSIGKYAELVGEPQLSGGFSRIVDASRLLTAIAQARTAASVAKSLDRPGLVDFETLGTERLLASLLDSPELTNFVEDELGPLLKHDSFASTPLLPTLRAYLEADGKKSAAAAKLFIQRRSLYNRLDKITRILGKDIDQPRVHQSLAVALQGLDLLERTSIGAGPLSRP